MALALGLGTVPDSHSSAWNTTTDLSCTPPYHPKGSIFNHSDTPNVSFSLDYTTESISYKTVRAIACDEELCIFYGHNLWFEPAGGCATRPVGVATEEPDDGWGGLSAVGSATAADAPGLQDDIVPDDELPFTQLKLAPDEDDDEDPDAIRTGTRPSTTLTANTA